MYVLDFNVLLVQASTGIEAVGAKIATASSLQKLLDREHLVLYCSVVCNCNCNRH
jgi:hypothetical protein